jgi:transposase|tara:strand:+ start:211 stop:1710 length:1500 start_codon:yes stop_codon:yes gene_type:complete
VQGKKEFSQRIYYNINLDSLVPEDHLLKRLEKLVSFDFVRDITKDYYSHTGKPSIDPLVLIKMLLVGYLFDIRSERKLVEEISLNLAYRWYIGYDLDEVVPNHSIFSKARTRFGKRIFKEIFTEILKTAISYGIVSKEGVLIDSSIIKADASAGSIVEINLSPEEYWRKLDESEKIKSPAGRKSESGTPVNTGSHFKGEPDKEKMGKRRRRTNSSYLKKRSTTDPDATLFYRPGAGSHLSYKAHIATDTNGIITAVAASPSSLHDTGAVPTLIESHENIMGTPTWIAADTKYGSEECLRYLQDRGIKTSINPETKSNRPGHYSKEEFKYDKERDRYICPEGNILERKAKNYKLNRIKYRAKRKDCLSCSAREKCIASTGNNPRLITHYDSQCYQKAKEWYHSNYGRTMQKLRSTVIEGVFGQAKVYHGLARSKFRGIAKVEIQFLMTATALNLKKMIRILDKDKLISELSRKISGIIQIVKYIFRNFVNSIKEFTLQPS